MNIFVLDQDPALAACYHTDKHVVKMILESAQMLSSAHRLLDGHEWANKHNLYKLTHQNHPCSIWARSSVSNYNWLYLLFVNLCKEYNQRYGKQHLTWTKLGLALAVPPTNIPHATLSPFAQAMPDAYKDNDAITAYRLYYISEKSSMFKWTNRPTPNWITNYTN